MNNELSSKYEIDDTELHEISGGVNVWLVAGTAGLISPILSASILTGYYVNR